MEARSELEGALVMEKKDKKSAKKDFAKTKKEKDKPAEGGMSISDPKVRWNCRPGPRKGK
jgi:hypothetical protein